MRKQQRRDKIARLISWGHWFTFANIVVVLAIGTLYVEAAEPPGSGLGTLYLLISWLGHFAFLPFVFFIILLFPFCLVVPYARVLRGIAALVGALGLLALIADALFFRYYGYHLNTYSLSRLALDAEAQFQGASFVIILGLLLTFVVVLAFELVLANLAWKRLEQIQQRRFAAPITTVFVLCFLTSHSIHIWADAVFYKPITQQDDLFPLSYPTTAKTLMAKHGLIQPEQSPPSQLAQLLGAQLGNSGQVAIDPLNTGVLQSVTVAQLRYPLGSAMCAKTATQPKIALVLFDELPPATVTRLMESGLLKRSEATMYAAATAAEGEFMAQYGLTINYADAITATGQAPAYERLLNDFNLALNVAHTEQVITQWSAHSAPDTQLSLLRASPADVDEAIAWLETGAFDKIMVTALHASTWQASQPQQANPQQLQVPLLTKGYDLDAQTRAQLFDLMPTVLADLLQCEQGFGALTQGRDLNQQPGLPITLLVDDYLIIVGQELVSVIDSRGDLYGFNPDDFSALPNSQPPTPVLIESVRQLQRFADFGAR